MPEGPRELLLIPCFTFPDNGNGQVFRATQLFFDRIASDILFELALPEGAIALRHRRSPAAGVPMPKTAVNEHGKAPSLICKVGSAG